MERLTELDRLVIQHFNLTAEVLQKETDEEKYPSLSAVATFCMHHGYHHIVYDKLSAYSYLKELAQKMQDLQ